MKTIKIWMLCIVCCCVTSMAFAQDDKKAASAEDEMMKAWMAYMTPGDVHKMMSSWDGTWSEDITMWMSPGAEAMKSKSSCTNSMIMGGRYQQNVHKGEFGGMPFEGMGTLAYDNGKKIFMSTWIDNMGTGMMMLEGPWDAKTNSCTLTGKQYDPVSGKDMMVREVFTVMDDKKHKMEMYMTPSGGKEYKSMEIIFTRM